jgi:hypothetical protein
MDYYFTQFKAKFGVTVGGHKINKTKDQINWCNNFNCRLDYI